MAMVPLGLPIMIVVVRAKLLVLRSEAAGTIGHRSAFPILYSIRDHTATRIISTSIAARRLGFYPWTLSTGPWPCKQGYA